MPGFLKRIIKGPGAEQHPQENKNSDGDLGKQNEKLEKFKEQHNESIKAPEKPKVGGAFARRPERRASDIRHIIKKRSDIQIPGVRKLDQQKERQNVIERNFADKKWIGRKAYNYKIEELENKIPDLKYEAKRQAIRDKKVLEQFRDTA